MKNVVYLTSNRADYGIVREYLQKLKNTDDINLKLLITGSILHKKEGFDLIQKDGHVIDLMVPLHLKGDTTFDITNAMSREFKIFGDYFSHHSVDLLIVLGDRYEIFPGVLAATMNKVRILHLHGGELTYGNYDEFIRHSITKMSHYHFTSTEVYRNRVIQLGENPKYVINVGALGCENCLNIQMENVVFWVKKFSGKKYFVILYHPETLTFCDDWKIIHNIFQLTKMYSNYSFIFIGMNQDTNAFTLEQEVKEFVKNHSNSYYRKNLNPDSYHYLLKNSMALIGNSSSGIIEAPMLKIPTINIGNRQGGRITSKSVITIDGSVEELKKAITDISTFSDDYYQSPYYQENSIEKAYLATIHFLKEKYQLKQFYDKE